MGTFHGLLLAISNELVQSDVCALRFLCQGLFSCTNLDTNNAISLFKKLQEYDLLREDDTSILQHLLWCISRNDLLRQKLNVTKQIIQAEMEIPGRSKIQPYRRLLLNLAQEVTDQELKAIKFILNIDIFRSSLDKFESMLDIFLEMEKMEALAENNLVNLKRTFTNVNKRILRMIEEYEMKNNGYQPHIEKNKDQNQFTRKVWKQRHTGSRKYNIQNLECRCDFPEIRAQRHDDLLQEEKVYKMSSTPRGICVIINNQDFETARKEVPDQQGFKDRPGTDSDQDSLHRVFTGLHFQTETHNNLAGEQILQTVQSYSSQNHEMSDCFICCILSHGNTGVIYGTNGQTVAIRTLTSCFTEENCPSLAGKPKVFFIQACQGHRYHEPVQIEADANKDHSRDGVIEDDFIPEQPDFLLGLATTLHHVSFRNRQTGSWYIQSLCQHLEERCPRGEDVLSILTRVNNDVSQKNATSNDWKQMPQPCSSLRKKLLFPVN